MPPGDHGDPTAFRLDLRQQRRLLGGCPLPATRDDLLRLDHPASFWSPPEGGAQRQYDGPSWPPPLHGARRTLTLVVPVRRYQQAACCLAAVILYPAIPKKRVFRFP